MITDSERNFILTGAGGMLGRHLHSALREAAPQPVLTLFHCAGTEEDTDAVELNVNATERLLRSLERSGIPQRVVYASTWQVYSPDAGEGVDEKRPAFARSEAGKAKARVEMMLKKWCVANGAVLTVVRPALMFGKGVDGAMLRLYNHVLRGRYVHIRGNDGKISAVTAFDAARAMILLAGHPGIFNLSDGRAHTWLALAEAMTANAGAEKRMPALPAKWADTIYRLFGRIPAVAEMLGPETQEPRRRTLVLDGSKAAAATGISFHDTLEVIARRDATYPYEDD